MTDMCARYVYTSDPNTVPAEYSVVTILPSREKIGEFHNIRRDMSPPVVFNEKAVRTLDCFRWGFVAPNSPDGRPPRVMQNGERRELDTINARDDRLLESQLYAPAFRARRCIIPARGFYEFKGRRLPKQPYYIRRKDNRVVSIAGIWSSWMSPGGVELRTFAIITTTPNAVVKKIHIRMPVILDRADYDAWLDRDNTDLDGLQAMLRPCADDLLVAHMLRQPEDKLEPVETEMPGDQAELF